MTDLVDHTLRMWRQGRHVWGQSDCMLSVGDYVAHAGGIDLTPEFRGTYATEAGAQAHLDANGDCEGLIDRMGVPRAPDAPQRGDVGVVFGVGALCTGDTWALRLERGVVEVNTRFAHPTAVWRVNA